MVLIALWMILSTAMGPLTIIYFISITSMAAASTAQGPHCHTGDVQNSEMTAVQLSSGTRTQSWLTSMCQHFWTKSWAVLGWELGRVCHHWLSQCIMWDAGNGIWQPTPPRSLQEERQFPTFPKRKKFQSVLSDSRTLNAECLPMGTLTEVFPRL